MCKQWTGTCIGKRNYRYFYLFTLSVFLGVLFIFFSALFLLYMWIKDRPTGFYWIRAVVCVVSLVWSIALGFSVGSLLALHTYLIIVRKTTYEFLSERVQLERERARQRKMASSLLHAAESKHPGPPPDTHEAPLASHSTPSTANAPEGASTGVEMGEGESRKGGCCDTFCGDGGLQRCCRTSSTANAAATVVVSTASTSQPDARSLFSSNDEEEDSSPLVVDQPHSAAPLPAPSCLSSLCPSFLKFLLAMLTLPFKVTLSILFPEDTKLEPMWESVPFDYSQSEVDSRSIGQAV